MKTYAVWEGKTLMQMWMQDRSAGNIVIRLPFWGKTQVVTFLLHFLSVVCWGPELPVRHLTVLILPDGVSTSWSVWSGPSGRSRPHIDLLFVKWDHGRWRIVGMSNRALTSEIGPCRRLRSMRRYNVLITELIATWTSLIPGLKRDPIYFAYRGQLSAKTNHYYHRICLESILKNEMAVCTTRVWLVLSNFLSLRKKQIKPYPFLLLNSKAAKTWW